MMRKLFYICMGWLLTWSCPIAQAQDCEWPIGICVDDALVAMPASTKSVLTNALTRIAVQSKINSDLGMSQFVLTARVDQLDHSVVPGAPVQVVNTLGVTLYVVDTYNKQIFSSEYFEVDGVGSNETKSYNAAFRSLNAQNTKVQNLIAQGMAKVKNYYDTQYASILKEAQRKADLQQYEEALALATAIPLCSKGGKEAEQVALQIYTKNLNRINVLQLNQAQALWASGPNAASAAAAAEILVLIDPEAACYPEAQALMKEVKQQIRKDVDFEMREKYTDQVDLEKARIEATRAIGTAYGNGQKEQTTNLAWVH